MPQKIVVKGTSGAGKSTFAAELARRCGLTYIELDALHWGPNWTMPPAEEFQARVEAALAAAQGGWVADGNYDSRLNKTVVAAADTIIWLDLPLGIKMYRLSRRTWRRVRGNIELWNGNRERWRDAFFGRESLFVWTIRQHVRHRRQWPSRFAADPRFIRLRSEAEVRRWLDEWTEGSSPTGCQS
jgi:adenylate kinase family enzyme